MVFKLVKTVEFEDLPDTADAIKPSNLEACHAILTCARAPRSTCAADLPLRMKSPKGGVLTIMAQIHQQAAKPVRQQKGRLPPPEWKTSRTFTSRKCSCAGGLCGSARAQLRTVVVYHIEHCGEYPCCSRGLWSFVGLSPSCTVRQSLFPSPESTSCMCIFSRDAARGTGAFRLVAWVSEGEGEDEPEPGVAAAGPAGAGGEELAVHPEPAPALAPEPAFGQQQQHQQRKVPPLHVSRRIDGSVPHETRSFPAQVGPRVAGGAGVAGAGHVEGADVAALEAEPVVLEPAPAGAGASSDGSEGMVFDVPREALGRVGGRVEHHVGSVSIVWDLGALEPTDPLQPYLNDPHAAMLSEYLGEKKLSVHSAVADIDLLNRQGNCDLFESTFAATSP